MGEQNKAIGVFTAMTGTGRRLKRWHAAKLITSEQLFEILDFEKGDQAKRFIRGLFGMAIFAIALGVLSIIAANWAYIPGSVKISAHFFMNVIAATAVWKADRSGNDVWREGSLILFFAFNLTLIILIGQVFQLSGNYAVALSSWMIISTPALLIYGRKSITPLVWAIAFLITSGCVMVEIAKLLPDLIIFYIYLSVSIYLPLSLIFIAVSDNVKTNLPYWSTVIFRTGVALVVCAATFSSMFWYFDLSHGLSDLLSSQGAFEGNYCIMALILLLAPISVYLLEWKKQTSKGSDRSFFIFIIGSLASISIPLILMPDEIELMGAIHFIGYWGFLGWVGYKLGYNMLITCSISFITIRLIIIYFELFGGLLLTGFGLIFSGILMLTLLHTAIKIKKKIGGHYASE